MQHPLRIGDTTCDWFKKTIYFYQKYIPFSKLVRWIEAKFVNCRNLENIVLLFL